MITILYNDLKDKTFNLSSYSSEKKLVVAWDRIKDNTDKKIVVQIETGERVVLRVTEIKRVTFDECIHVNAQVHANIKDYRANKAKSAQEKVNNLKNKYYGNGQDRSGRTSDYDKVRNHYARNNPFGGR